METKHSHGREIIAALQDAGVVISPAFQYQELPASKKDAACRALMGSNTWMPTECIPGAAQFGDHLEWLFWEFPMFYVVSLKKRLIDNASACAWLPLEDALAHSADLLNCEATVRAGLSDKQALMLLFSDPLEFIRVVNAALVKYLNDFIQDEIKDVLREVVCH